MTNRGVHPLRRQSIVETLSGPTSPGIITPPGGAGQCGRSRESNPQAGSYPVWLQPFVAAPGACCFTSHALRGAARYLDPHRDGRLTGGEMRTCRARHATALSPAQSCCTWPGTPSGWGQSRYARSAHLSRGRSRVLSAQPVDFSAVLLRIASYSHFLRGAIPGELLLCWHVSFHPGAIPVRWQSATMKTQSWYLRHGSFPCPPVDCPALL